MAVTTPDNLYSPDDDNAYALVQDLGLGQDTTQAAFIKRANMYVGTSAQRTAFTTAPEGVHWQDTNGSKFEFVRRAGDWVPRVVGRAPFTGDNGGGTSGFTWTNSKSVTFPTPFPAGTTPVVVLNVNVGADHVQFSYISTITNTGFNFRVVRLGSIAPASGTADYLAYLP